MSECGRDCGCRGESNREPAPQSGTSRRDLLRIGLGTAGLLGMPMRRAKAAPGDIPPNCKVPPPQAWFDQLVQPGEPIVYRGEQLRNLIFPLGGIGTGTVWLNGQGRLVNWQIFNNIQKKTHVDDTFLAIRIEQENQPPIVRVLATAPAAGLTPMQSLEILGRYPIATVRFMDRNLPVDVELDAWNPLIPLDEQSSAIPCALFSVRVNNKSNSPVRVSLLASLQNAVGHAGVGASAGIAHPTYGGNHNRLAQTDRTTAIILAAEPGKPSEISPPISLLVDHHELPALDEAPVNGLYVTSIGLPPSKASMPTVYWLSEGNIQQLGGAALTEIAEGVRERGAMLLLSGVDNTLADPVSPTLPQGVARAETVYEPFESANFGKWTTQGDAFKRPRPGTMSNQNPVTGFLGAGMVNSYDPDDERTGTLTSPLFAIQQKYVSFLVGGGANAGCQVRLKVEGQVVLTATGKNTETLERVEWDVSKWNSREAQIEIVDQAKGGWAHILADDIRFSNVPVSAITVEEAKAWNELLAEVRKAPPMAATGYGRGKVMLVPVELGRAKPGVDRLIQRDKALQLIASLAGATYRPATGRPESAPSFGTMCLATGDPDVSWLPVWTDAREIVDGWTKTGKLDTTPPAQAAARAPSGPGETVNAALNVDRAIPAGQSTTATFVMAWHFPHQYYPQNSWKIAGNPAIEVGNMYANWWPDALTVARHTLTNLKSLERGTRAYVKAMFDTTLPQYLVDAAAANVSILRGPTCFWTKAGTFYGFEGCGPDGGGCCPMNCNHVWNYEQTLAKVWPALERNMRATELEYHLQDDGGINHRVTVPRDNPAKGAFPVADGQCGAILKAYREHLQSPDRRWLEANWPRIKKAMDHAISAWDSDLDGIMDKPQFNTYDRVIYGQNTFISSLYLAALRAAEVMAGLMKDAPAADKYRDLLAKGREKISKTLYNGEYYIQKADNINLGYGIGCLADQVVGVWWARILGLGDVLPAEQVRSSLSAIFKYCWLWSQEGFQGTQRFLQFADGKDKGLLIGAWPRGGRPDDPILYRDEIWTGVEYQVAGHKLYEGQISEALTIVRGARERYDGVKKSPWNEIECGDYYARALSSWSLLLGAQGYFYDGPERLLQFDPRVAADDHRSFFSTAEGWGQFHQKREVSGQTCALALAHGRCDLRTLRFGVPAAAKSVKGEARMEGRALNADVKWEDGFAVVALRSPITLSTGQTIEVVLTW